MKSTHLTSNYRDSNPDIPILKQAKAEYAKLDKSSTTLPADRPHR